MILHKKSILKKTIQVGSSTLLSRVFGLLRDILLSRYLGTGAISDSFLTAYKIPNFLRKIFAEGALSAAFIPTLVNVMRSEGKKQASSLISLGFIIFEGFLILWCSFVMLTAKWWISVIAPGFSAEQIQYTVPYLQILMPFILFISSSALLAGALQTVGHFFVPAFAPVLLNIVFIIALFVCMHFNLAVEWLCGFIIFGGLLQFLCHLYMYFKLHFNFNEITQTTKKHFIIIFYKFLPCLITLSIAEISIFISTSLASYLPSGSISLMNYAFGFLRIPLGVFAIAFSTILLPHFSRITSYAPKRLSYYLLETSKFVFWITIPSTILMIFFSEKIFYTTFLSSKFTIAQVYESASILTMFLFGLFFFSFNKILLNMYYALHVTWIPTIISLIATTLNVALDLILMKYFNATGLAIATTISIGMVQTVLLVTFLFVRFKFRSYIKNFGEFVFRYSIQMACIMIPTYFVYRLLEFWIAKLPSWLSQFMLNGLGFWIWVGPLCLLIAAALFYLRKLFKVKLYFLELS